MPKLDEKAKKDLVAQLKKEILEAHRFKEGIVDANFKIDDACCARYLRAREFNLTKARKMLEGTIEWRKRTQVANLVAKNFPTIEKEAATGKTFVSDSYDIDGRVMIIMRNRLENTKDHDGNVLHLVYQMERAVARTETTKHDKWLLIIDFDGYSLRNAPPMKTSKATLSVMQDHYPERLYKAVLMSAPFLFNVAFKALSPFIDPVTRDKIVFINGGSPKKRCDHIAQYAPLDSIESCLGGTSDFVYDVNTYLADDRKTYHQALKLLEVVGNETTTSSDADDDASGPTAEVPSAAPPPSGSDELR